MDFKEIDQAAKRFVNEHGYYVVGSNYPMPIGRTVDAPALGRAAVIQESSKAEYLKVVCSIGGFPPAESNKYFYRLGFD